MDTSSASIPDRSAAGSEAGRPDVPGVRAFGDFVTAVRSQGLKVVLFGGFALPAHGVERSTLDIDLLICDEDLGALCGLANRAGYVEVLRTPQYARYGTGEILERVCRAMTARR